MDQQILQMSHTFNERNIHIDKYKYNDKLSKLNFGTIKNLNYVRNIWLKIILIMHIFGKKLLYIKSSEKKKGFRLPYEISKIQISCFIDKFSIPSCEWTTKFWEPLYFI